MALTFHEHMRGYHHGQSDMTLAAKLDGVVVGWIDYSVYKGSPSIQMVETDPAHRRKGIATAMLRHLQSLYPEAEISMGMLTPDGAAWLPKVPTEEVVDREVLAGQRRLDALRGEQAAMIARLESGSGIDYDRYNELTDAIHDLEANLDRRPVIRRYFR